ncbi:MAG: glycoside hydrolase family 2, partial [Planctomycetes bacterium]|nr:glycoside hydrolase family 2 [Planctomycetota bacterium]
MPKGTDIFAKIGRQFKHRWSSELCEPPAPQLPDIFLPADRNNSRAVFKPSARLDSFSKLNAELARQRRRHQKFLRDMAPGQKPFRKAINLTEFNWRRQTAEDSKNFTGHTLPGAGSWQKVKIPHYGPPLGRAVTYYRTSFNITQSMLAKGVLFICFKGADYKTEAFVNGTHIGSHEGFFAPFEFNFMQVARAGENNLVVKIENDATCMGNDSWGEDGHRYEGDKIYAATGPGYDEPEVGWHHCPPGMGIYQDVYIEARPQVHLDDIFIRPIISEEKAQAHIEITNTEIEFRKVALRISVFGQNFRKTVIKNMVYRPQTTRIRGVGDLAKPGDGLIFDLLMGPGVNYLQFDLNIPNPRLWSPAEPWLYQIQVELLDENDVVIDTMKQQFGMREFRLDEEHEPKGRFFLNGQPVKLRGANTMGHMQQCVMKKDFEQLRDDILLGKICNLNFLRFTQRPVQPEIYEYCDRLGMMVQTDLPLFGCLRRNKFCDALIQVQEMEKLVRSHPCNILVTYINEPFPNAMGKPQRHLSHDKLRAFFKAADIVVHQTNPDRVIKPVDGDYDPPSPSLPDNHCYCGWYLGNGIDLGKLHKGYWLPVKPGWNYSCGEFGAEALDPVDLMRRYYPRHWLAQTAEEEKTWTPNSIPHCQTGKFHYMWFDRPSSLEGWVSASQAHQKWANRLMIEAFRRDNRMISFCLHLLIDAFPSGWMKAVMDCERRAKPAYFACREALCPVMVHFRTDRVVFFAGEEIPLEAWICNDLNRGIKNARLHYQMELNGKVVFANRTKAEVAPLLSRFQGFLRLKAPMVNRRSKVVMRLALIDSTGK